MRQRLILLFCGAYLFVIANQFTVGTFSVQAQSESSPVNNQAQPKEKADIAYKILLDSYNKYLDNVFKTAGLFLLALGWIVTSDKARQFLQENRHVRIAVFFIAMILAMVHASSLYGDSVETNNQLKLLNEINYIPSAYFERYRITTAKLVGSLLISFLGFAAMLVSIYSLGDKSKDSAA